MMGQEEAALLYLFRRYQQRKDSKQKEIEEKKKREKEERRKQREELSKIEEEINNLRRRLEENDAKLKENKAKLKEVQQEHKVQQQEVQQVSLDESSNKTSPIGFECKQSVVGIVTCPLKIEKSTMLEGTPMKKILEAEDKKEEVIQSTQVEDEELDQEEENNPLEGHKQQVNVGVETKSEQQEVVVEPCEEKVLAAEEELVIGVVADNICPDDGDVDTNDQEGKDVAQRSDAEGKTIDDRDEVFVDECDTLEIYKQGEDHIVDPVDWYAGDMRLTKVFLPKFNEDTMNGIHSKVWNQHVMASGINSVIIVIPYNRKTRKKITAIQRDLNFSVPGSMMQAHLITKSFQRSKILHIF